MTDLRRQQICTASRRYWRKIAGRRLDAGLTTRGTPRIYREWPRPVPSKAQKQRIVRAEWAALGITTRGTKKVRFVL